MPARELKTVVLKIVFCLVFVSSSSDHCYKRKGFFCFVLFCLAHMVCECPSRQHVGMFVASLKRNLK